MQVQDGITICSSEPCFLYSNAVVFNRLYFWNMPLANRMHKNHRKSADFGTEPKLIDSRKVVSETAGVSGHAVHEFRRVFLGCLDAVNQTSLYRLRTVHTQLAPFFWPSTTLYCIQLWAMNQLYLGLRNPPYKKDNDHPLQLRLILFQFTMLFRIRTIRQRCIFQ